ncbi:MAG: glycosyltransferase family 8 protein, partial [Flavisolibacter sp.]
NTITLVTVSNNHFIALLAVLAKSIDANHLSDEFVDMYIVDDNISFRNKQKLQRSIINPRLKVIWVAMEEVLARGKNALPNDSSSFPLSVYIRLCLPNFLPARLEKAIYLDADTLVLEEIAKLWRIEMGDKMIAGVVDRAKVVSSNWGGIKNYKELGLSEDIKYFNSGVLIINLKEWRINNITETLFKCLKANKKWLNFPDQYGLNVVFANQWFELDHRWNCIPFSDEKHPYIIHFIGRKPIFKEYDYNEEYKRLFFNYLELTEWKDFRQKSELSRLAKKLYNKSIKKLKSIFQTNG